MPAIRSLPDGVEKYAESPLFAAGKVPESLQKSHSTKEGTYARLIVTAGQVQYFLVGESTPVATLDVGDTFIILPAEEHFVQVTDDAEFYLEFCR
ncbi:DUF1971 domain-containing protein [uncultured Tateyamaria sp.]|uniref:DUF1971 domain-containing protein n=1 Tax=uncultured Tateyamaria sp. TaxID=455651 RepID=UPI00261B299E|nr:DUF1971 domain-containing protein [uncultured Tateyamaria sp.]